MSKLRLYRVKRAVTPVKKPEVKERESTHPIVVQQANPAQQPHMMPPFYPPLLSQQEYAYYITMMMYSNPWMFMPPYQ